VVVKLDAIKFGCKKEEVDGKVETKLCKVKEFEEKNPDVAEQLNGFDEMVMKTTKNDVEKFRSDCVVLEAHKNNVICIHKEGSSNNFRKALKVAHINAMNRKDIKNTTPLEVE